METLLGLFAIAALVFTNGFFVAAEFSLVGARRTRIAQLAAEGSGAARVAQHALDHLDSYIAATQLGITLSSLALGWIGEPAIGHIFEALLGAILPHDMLETVSRTASVVLAFSVVTLLHIVLGELVPKSIALQQPEATSLIVARPVTWFLALFRPIIRLMNGVGNAIVRLLGFKPAGEHGSVHSAEELEMLVHSSREAGLIAEHEEQLLRRVFDFSDITVEEIMQPRVAMNALPLDMPVGPLLDRVCGSHHSRYPVYGDSVDEIVGVLLSKDLLDVLVARPELLAHRDQTLDLKPLLREPLFVPHSLTVDELLKRMRQTKVHLAVIIDEFGGTAGLATLEDVIELLVGEVHDEFDEGEIELINAAAGGFLVDGLASLTEVSERFGELEAEPDSTTLGGFVAETLERIPQIGDRVPFGRYDVTVLEMDGLRVARLRFTLRADAPPDAAEASS